jgi:outer membrane protein assembly factor BamD (BamD/ComL family)
MTFVTLIKQLLPLFAVLIVFGWFIVRWVKKSDEPGSLIFRLALTFGLAIGLACMAARAHDEFAKIATILVAAVVGLVYAVLWGPSFCAIVAKQFTSLYDGGDEEAEPCPLYSMAEAKRKQGKYLECIADIRNQLNRFPNDFIGWMMLADVQAENLTDLAAAQDTIERLLAQEGHSPKNISYALNRVADWHLKIAQDPKAARDALERILQLLPDTEQAQLAHQRLAHLTSEKDLLEKHDRPRITLKHYQENIGLRHDFTGLKPIDEDPAAVAGKYVKHLDQFPHDNEIREKLALIYADHYGRLDLAKDQLEQLISTPNQPPKQVVHWLNLLADLQIKLAGDAALARQTLQRIVDSFPKTAAAENALHRIAYLKLEMKPHEKSQAIKLGSYEQNIGLRK